MNTDSNQRQNETQNDLLTEGERKSISAIVMRAYYSNQHKHEYTIYLSEILSDWFPKVAPGWYNHTISLVREEINRLLEQKGIFPTGADFSGESMILYFSKRELPSIQDIPEKKQMLWRGNHLTFTQLTRRVKSSLQNALSSK